LEKRFRFDFSSKKTPRQARTSVPDENSTIRTSAIRISIIQTSHNRTSNVLKARRQCLKMRTRMMMSLWVVTNTLISECWVKIINNYIWDAYLFLLWELTYKQNIFINVIFINGNIIYLNEKFNLSVILRMILTHKMRMAISREVLPMRNLSWNVPSALTLSSTRPHSTCTPHSFTTEKRFL
jgi:hypothetical protein